MSKHYFVGSDIAALAGATFLIRDGDVSGKDIVIFEESHQFGGAFDAHGDADSGYYMSGSRMFEAMYLCTFDLLASIPSLSNPNISIKEETDQANAATPWHNKVRLVDRDGNILDAHAMGFSERDRLDLIKIMVEPERMLDDKRITDCFDDHFFQTHFWFEWCTLFAFERWHSAIEFKRYLQRFVHHFSTIDTQENIYRSLYNQYDSFAVPLVRWLQDRGVEFRYGVRVENLRFASGTNAITATHIDLRTAEVDSHIELGESDKVFVTNGSMTADKAFGSMSRTAPLNRNNQAGAWRLWETLAEGRPQFGNPAAFNGNIAESVWISYTVTVKDPLFFNLMEAYGHSKPGTGGLITFKDSSWLITVSIYHQPFFPNQPDGTFVWWGYGLFHDRPGDYVKKPMIECTGAEILREVLGHLRFSQQDSAVILAQSNCIPCTMPYITSQFMVRNGSDRPKVIPTASTNLAFIGQYTEQPDDVVFTVEYSVRSAMNAVYGLLKLDKKPPAIFKGLHHPEVILDAIRTMHQ